MRAFWRKEPERVEEKPLAVVEARLPGQSMGTGRLDRGSPTWIFVEAWARERLSSLREKNDTVSRDATQTAVLRGEIKAMKDLISLPTPRGLLSNDD